MDTSRDAEYLAKTDRSLLQQHNFDMDHVLTGEVNAAGRATGYHAEFAADAAAAFGIDTHNLQLHPSERKLAQELASKSAGQ